MKEKRLHSWRRAIHPARFRKPKTYDNFFFICSDPDCSVKKRFEDIMGKYSKCPKCGGKFIVEDNQWDEYDIICNNCKILQMIPSDIFDGLISNFKDEEVKNEDQEGERELPSESNEGKR
jgi:hypothetical protein